MAKRYLGGGVSFEQKDVYQEFSEDPGGGGSSSLSGLTDVNISNPSDGQTLVYDATTKKWENGAGGGGILVCHIGSENTLDKTYREIVNADMAVLKVSEEGMTSPLYLGNYDDIPTNVNTGAKAGWQGHLEFVFISGTIDNSALPIFRCVASDPDGYPVVVSD